MARDPGVELNRLRERLKTGERGGSDRDRDVLLEFSRRLTLDRASVGKHRHLKLLRHCTRVSEQTEVELADTLEKRSAAESALAWIHREYDIDETPETNRDYRAALRAFGRRMNDEDECVESLAWIKTTYPNSHDPAPNPSEMLWWDEHIRPMLDAAANPRDRAMIAVGWDAGPRSGELRSLRVGDVADHDYGLSITVDGKQGQRSVVLVPSVPYLQAWLAEHPARGEPDAPLWCNLQTGEPTTYQRKRDALKRTAKNAGITHVDVDFTLLRKSSASYLASQGVSQAHLEDHHGWVRGSDKAARYIAVFDEANDRAIAAAHGVDVEEDEVDAIAPVTCPRCEKETPRDLSFCLHCSQSLDMERKALIDDVRSELADRLVEAEDSTAREELIQIDRTLEQKPNLADVSDLHEFLTSASDSKSR